MVVECYTTCLGCIVNASAATATYNTANTTSLATSMNNNDNDTSVLCSSCVRASLQSVRERHQLAKETWYESRTKCTQYFQRKPNTSDQGSIATFATPTTMNESTIRIYEQKYQHLRKELETLQQD